ncbi:uncharacterized protein FOKN1_0581 [Thiohalobacter thiocyanaticus]|uniref:Uncharacterized protein n=1 Tax=Thiohalobacter thiocyanaticus TaxID=585455 RepID=A0A1Z4VN98_9GAMM|nr:uncharacterized protein FOKN1_0581 [Thiohalobacter thiocyanaticus]
MTGGLATSRILTLLASVVGARILEVEEFGRFTLFVTVALLMADMGRPIDNAYVRETSGKHNVDAESYYHYSVRLKLALVAVALLAWIPVWAYSGSVYASIPGIIGAAMVVGSFWMITYSLLSDFQRRQQFMRVGLLNPLTGLTLLLAVAVVAAGGEPGLGAVVICTLVLSLAVAVFNLALIFKRRAARLYGDERKRFLKLVWVFFSSGAVLQLAGRLDTLLVAAMTNMRELAYYGAAARTAGPVGMLGAGAGMLLLPVARQAYESSRGLHDYVRRSLLYNMAQLAVLALLFAFSDQIVLWLFGEGYGASAVILKWLLLSRMLSALVVPYRVLLQASQRPGRLFSLSLIRMFSGAAGILALVPVMGASGAAVGLSVGEFVTLCSAAAFVHRGWRHDREF